MGGGSHTAEVLDLSEEVRILDDHARRVFIDRTLEILKIGIRSRARSDLDPFHIQIAAITLDHAAENRRNRAGNHNLPPAGDLDRHHHRFKKRRPAVVKARVGNLHAGQAAHRGLILVDRLKRSLRGFRLVRGIGGIEFSAGDNAVDDRRNDVVVISAADEVNEIRGIHVRKMFEMPDDLVFGFPLRNSLQRRIRDTDARLLPHILQARKARGFQHLRAITFSIRNIRHNHFSLFNFSLTY